MSKEKLPKKWKENSLADPKRKKAAKRDKKESHSSGLQIIKGKS